MPWPTEFERELQFWMFVILSISSVVVVVTMIFALRAVHLTNIRIREILVVGNRVRLVQPLKLELGTLGAGNVGEIKAIYERPPSLKNKKVPRRIALIQFHGFQIAMSATDMKYYFVPRFSFRWQLPKEERGRVEPV